jgi:hypothetical protein
MHEMLHVLGYLFAIVIGLTMGIFGGGGTVMTLPVLVYLFQLDAKVSVAYSLFVVGTSSLAGSVGSIIKKEAEFKAALSFGLPSIIAVIITRLFLVPLLPEIIFQSANFTLRLDSVLLLLFAVLMISVATFMLRTRNKQPIMKAEVNYLSLLWKALAVGVLSGILGAGGGFIIVPALMAFYQMDTRRAVATSLLIISFNSFIGFFSHFDPVKTDWEFLSIFSGLAVLGIFAGMWLAKKIPATKLKTAFALFVLGMGIYVIVHEIFFR